VRSRSVPALGAVLLLLAAGVRADDPSVSRRPQFDIDFAIANIDDDSLRWSLGRERQTKLPYVIIALSGDLESWLSYRIELNAVNESVKPEPFTPPADTTFFYPNLADPEAGVSSNPEGAFKVDDYKTTGWDPYIQEAHLRRAFMDIHTKTRKLGLVLGRFFVPQGLPLEELRWFTAQDMTHIELINAAVDQGGLAYWRFGSEPGNHGLLTGGVIGGNGNPYHDYVYFDFTRTSQEDTNSAVGGVVMARYWTKFGLDLIATYKHNYIGSRIESDPSLGRSKHYDDATVGAVRYRPTFYQPLTVFAELARYKWGLRDTSAELFPGPTPPTTPIYKDGYNLGAELAWPIQKLHTKAGVVFIREELDRDDSLIGYLADTGQLGVSLGKKERRTIVKLFAEFGPLTAFFFHNSVDNPFPQVSAIVPISGPFAYQGPGSNKIGFGVRLKASF